MRYLNKLAFLRSALPPSPVPSRGTGSVFSHFGFDCWCWRTGLFLTKASQNHDNDTREIARTTCV